MPPSISTYPDQQQLATAAADLLVQQIAATLATQPRCSLVLTGGTTPVLLYRLLAQLPYRTQIAWERLWVLWGDERYVPLADPQSNAGIAMRELLDHVPIPPAQVLPMPTTYADPHAAAAAYQQQVQQILAGGTGQLDIVLLGMGPDGHIASLFPDHAALTLPDTVLVTAIDDSPKPPPQRITLTLPALQQAGLVLLLVAGAEKAAAVQRSRAGDLALPAARVQPPHGRVLWLLDAAAATAR
ncbi:MAG: 6-phosphogluconolactonase [Chloroflexaceae bacterium]|nr:6-phosphogluconolactonase [Chloroflexaceae bacterium]